MGKKRVSVLLFLMLYSAFLSCQESPKPSFKNTILFKVSHPKTDKESYLFGTHHAFGKPFFDSLSKANQALESCDILIKENVNIPGEMAEDIINRRIATTSWRKYLSQDELKFVMDLFRSSPTDFNKMTPTEMYVFLNRYFNQQVCLNKTSDDTSLTLDDYIGDEAGLLNMDVIGLETTEQQIEMINKDVEGMPKKVHKRRLSNIIGKINAHRLADCNETDWYLNMEIDYQLDQPCTNALLLADRNDKWLTKILPMIEKNSCFIAVGLSHLMYACGLINELKANGYLLEPVMVK